MAENVGNLNAKLSLDATTFTEGLEKAQKKAEGFVSNLQSTLGGGNVLGGLSSTFGTLTNGFGALTSAMSPLTAGLGILAVGIKDIVSEYKKMVDAGTESVKQQIALSRRFDMSTSSIAALQLATSRFGVSMDDATTALSHMYQMLGKVQAGSSTAAAAFHGLGLDANALAANPSTALDQVLRAMATASSTQRQSSARAIFGRGGIGMADVGARLGEGGLAGVENEGLASGAIASQDQVAAVREILKIRRETKELEETIAHIRENQAAGGWIERTIAQGQNNYARERVEREQREASVRENGGVYGFGVEPQRVRFASAHMTPGAMRTAGIPVPELPPTQAVTDKFEAMRDGLNDTIGVLRQQTKTAEEYKRAMERQKLISEGLTRAMADEIVARRGLEHALQVARGYREHAASMAEQNGMAGLSPVEQQSRTAAAPGRQAIGALFQQFMQSPSAGAFGHLAEGSMTILRSFSELQQQIRQGAQNQLREQTATPLEHYQKELRDLHESANGDAGLEARGRLGALGRFEGSLGLNQPVRQASLSTRGSAAAVAAINTAQLQATGPKSVEERMANLLQTLVELQNRQLERQGEMVRAQERQGAPAVVNNVI